MKILFWNIGTLHDITAAAVLCVEGGADIFLLAECDAEQSAAIIVKINAMLSERYYYLYNVGIPTLVFITRYPSFLVGAIADGSRHSIREVKPPASGAIIITSVHLPSKLHVMPEDQEYVVRKLRMDIEEAETKLLHKNTIVIGDFNCNPFENAMVAADGFNAVMDANTVERAHRTIRGDTWSAFYNPMWSLLGDESRGPSGTYFHRSGGIVNYYWNMFDQVIIRPSLIPFLDHENVHIHSDVNGMSLLRDNIIDARQVDHLPISIVLNVEGKLQ